LSVAKSKKVAAKRSRRRAGKLETLAAGVGTALGTAQNKAEDWLSDPKQMLLQMTNVRDAANRLIAQLTRSAAVADVQRLSQRAKSKGASKRKTAVSRKPPTARKDAATRATKSR
jgi:hypothetical protein